MAGLSRLGRYAASVREACRTLAFRANSSYSPAPAKVIE